MKPLWQYLCVVPFVFLYFTKIKFRIFLNFDVWRSWELKSRGVSKQVVKTAFVAA